MGKFKRSKKRRLVELQCFEKDGVYVVCKKIKGGWEQVNDQTYNSCQECTTAIGTTECF